MVRYRISQPSVCPDSQMQKEIIVQDNAFVRTIGFGALRPNDVWTIYSGSSQVSHPEIEARFEARVAARRAELEQRAKETGQPAAFHNSLLPRNEHLVVYPEVPWLNIRVGITDYFHYSTTTKDLLRQLDLGDFEDPKYHHLFTNFPVPTLWGEDTHPLVPNPITAVMGLVVEKGKYVVFTKPKQVRDEQDIIGLPGGYGNLIVSQPGEGFVGDVEQGEYRPERTAIRETHEETGVGPEQMKNLVLRGRVIERLTLDKIDTCLVYTAEAPGVSVRKVRDLSKAEVDILVLPYKDRNQFLDAALGNLAIRQGYTLAAMHFLIADRYGAEAARQVGRDLGIFGKQYAQMEPGQMAEEFKKQAASFEKRTSPYILLS